MSEIQIVRDRKDKLLAKEFYVVCYWIAWLILGAVGSVPWLFEMDYQEAELRIIVLTSTAMVLALCLLILTCCYGTCEYPLYEREVLDDEGAVKLLQELVESNPTILATAKDTYQQGRKDIFDSVNWKRVVWKLDSFENMPFRSTLTLQNSVVDVNQEKAWIEPWQRNKVTWKDRPFTRLIVDIECELGDSYTQQKLDELKVKLKNDFHEIGRYSFSMEYSIEGFDGRIYVSKNGSQEPTRNFFFWTFLMLIFSRGAVEKYYKDKYVREERLTFRKKLFWKNPADAPLDSDITIPAMAPESLPYSSDPIKTSPFGSDLSDMEKGEYQI